MRRLLVLAVLLFSFATHATSFSSNVIVSTDYIYRGLSYSNNTPVIEGTLDFVHDGFAATWLAGPTYTLNLTSGQFEPDGEFDTFVSYSHQFGNLTLTGGYDIYLFYNNPTNDMLEWAGHAAYSDFKLNLTYIDNFVRLNTKFSYIQLQYTPKISDNVMLTSHLGYSYFSNEAAVACSRYFDYKVGVAYAKESWYVELFYTNTLLRRDLTLNQIVANDGALNLTVMRTFSWL